MNAKFLRAILENVHDEVDIFVNVNGYDEEVGGTYFNDEQGYLSLIPVEEEVEEDDPTDVTGTSCDLPERFTESVNVKEL
jgi:hypothetical protein